MKCKVCGSEVFQKFGTYVRAGISIQRLKCKVCDEVASDTACRPLGSLRIPIEQAALVVRLLAEGNGIRGSSRISGLQTKTVLRILEHVGEKCASLLDERVHGLACVNVEADEIFSYVGTRPENAAVNELGRGEIYCFLGICRESKLIISHVVGKRTARNCLNLMTDIKSRLAERTQLSTDGFAAYWSRNGAVAKAFGDDVDYGTEIKRFGSPLEVKLGHYRPAICLGVTRQNRIGSPNLATVNTSRVERMNLSVRHFNRRFTRHTLGFSRKIQNHRHAVRLLIAHFNFCRCHSSLKNGIARTPAMASGLTDHVWTIEELLQAR